MFALRVFTWLLCNLILASVVVNTRAVVPHETEPSRWNPWEMDDEEPSGEVEGNAYDDDDEGDGDDDDDDDDDEDDDDDGDYRDPWAINSIVNSEKGNLTELFDALDCDGIFSSYTPPIHDESTWLLLRGTYRGTVGPAYSTIAVENFIKNGFDVEYYVDYIPGKGRGVFAGQDITNGTKIWNAYHTATFYFGEFYRKFLASLPRPLACDVMVWAYVEREIPHDPESSVVNVDLDPCSFINTIDTPEELNVGKDYVALRDISAGEELMVDYTEFHVYGGWADFGL